MVMELHAYQTNMRGIYFLLKQLFVQDARI